MEVDELVAEVFLPRKVKASVEQLKAIECGKPCKIGPFHASDLLRYVLTGGLILFAYFYWLDPFHGSVEAAAMALCGGRKDFSQTGGTADISTVVLLENQDFISGCPDEHFENNYLPNHYPRVNRSRQKKQMTTWQYDLAATEETRLRTTLQYAFSNCSSGQITDPDGECKTVTEYFTRNLPDGVEPGGSSAPPQCKRFDPEQTATTCQSTQSGESCTWTWQGFQCEGGNPPGSLHQRACSSSDFDQLKDSCHVWEDIFSQTHPSMNCLIPKSCTTLYCLGMAGQLALTIGNVNTYEANENVTKAAISSGLSTALGVSSNSVTILQIRGWPVDWDRVQTLLGPPKGVSQQVQAEGGLLDSFWEDTEPPVDNNSIALVKFLVSSLPVTLIPSSIPESATQLAVQIDTALGNGTVTSVQFTPWPPLFAADTDVKNKLRPLLEAHLAQSGGSLPHLQSGT